MINQIYNDIKVRIILPSKFQYEVFAYFCGYVICNVWKRMDGRSRICYHHGKTTVLLNRSYTMLRSVVLT